MTSQTMGLVIGGVIPAILFSFANLFAKASNQAGIGIGPYVFFTGIAVVLVGLVLLFVIPDRAVSLQSGSYAFGMGCVWGIGIACIAVGLTTYGAPIGKLVPLFNANTLLSVIFGLWIFAEWQQVKVLPLLFGTFLILAGAVIVARA